MVHLKSHFFERLQIRLVFFCTPQLFLWVNHHIWKYFYWNTSSKVHQDNFLTCRHLLLPSYIQGLLSSAADDWRNDQTFYEYYQIFSCVCVCVSARIRIDGTHPVESVNGNRLDEYVVADVRDNASRSYVSTSEWLDESEMCTLEMTYGPNLIRCRFRKEKLPDGSELFAMEHPRKCFSFFLFLILKFSFFFFFIEKNCPFVSQQGTLWISFGCQNSDVTGLGRLCNNEKVIAGVTNAFASGQSFVMW
jgi:hypothetical protein